MSSLLNRQPAPLNRDALEMLRSKNLTKYTQVVASDGHPIGVALRFRHRTEDINPDLKLYATYLEVAGVELGNNSFIPTDFIKDYDPAAGLVTLAVPFDIVEDETWNRAPTFIALRQDKIEPLPEA